MEESVKKSYYSDTSHNYMVLACPEDMQDNYQYRMLAANQIRGLLPCSGRTIDNREYLYYEITSRQNLTDLYERRPVRGRDLRKLLEDLSALESKLSEYLLDTAHLLLDPTCIYVDYREQACGFAYYPGEVPENGWIQLFTFLADHVDGADRQAAAMVYRLCMLAEKPGFCWRKELLEELGIPVPAPENDTEERLRRNFLTAGQKAGNRYSAEEIDPYDRGGPADRNMRLYPGKGFEEDCETDRAARRDRPDRDDQRDQSDGIYGTFHEGGYGRDLFAERMDEGTAYYRNMREKIPDPETGNRPGIYRAGSGNSALMKEREAADTGTGIRHGKRKGKPAAEEPEPAGKHSEGTKILWKMVCGLILCVTGAALCVLGEVYPIAERELLLSHAAGGVFVIAGAVLLVLYIRGRRNRDEADPDSTGWEPARTNADDMYGEYMWPQGEYFPAGTGEWADPVSWGGGQKERAGLRIREAAETSLLGSSVSCEGLYGTGEYRGEQILLSRLPCVVGKMQDYVDQVLEDSSISRMHARFSRGRDGEMTVRDLNSTNGTWLNGERLQPNESRTVRPGDRIRMGRMEFVYR